MATIQIRDVPEEAFETLRRRARSEGRSIQAYMRERVVEMAATRTKAEHLLAIDQALAHYGGTDAPVDDIIADIAAADRR